MFDQLPELVAEMNQRLERIERLLLELPQPSAQVTDALLNIKQAAELLHLSVPTLYGKVHQREIPVCKKAGRLYFFQKDLEEWIKSGKMKTMDAIRAEADAYFQDKHRRVAR